MSSLNIFDVFGNQIISEIDNRINKKLNESHKEIDNYKKEIDNRIDQKLNKSHKEIDNYKKEIDNRIDKKLNESHKEIDNYKKEIETRIDKIINEYKEGVEKLVSLNEKLDKIINVIDISKNSLNLNKNRRIVGVNPGIDKNDVVIKDQLDHLENTMKVLSLDKELETTKEIVRLTENFNVLVDILNDLITEYNKLKTETGKTFENIDMKFLGLAD